MLRLKNFVTFLFAFLLVGCSPTTPLVVTPPLNAAPSIENATGDSSSVPEVSISKFQGSEIHFIDTGNSDSILIKEATKSILIDGADNDDEHSLVAYLKEQGIENLTYVIATHPHADHIGALDAVIENFTVDTLLVANGDADTATYRDFIEAAMAKNLQPSTPLEGSTFKLDEGSFAVFNSNGGSNTNDQSLVILYTYGNYKVLLTGDAEAETENEILSKLSDVDILKVGHHGSSSSTTDAFLNKVNPEYAVITVGTPNKYGHPHVETMNKLEDKQIKVHRTDECGNVVFTLTEDTLQTTCKPGSYLSGNEKAEKTQPEKTPVTDSAQNSTNHQSKVYYTPKGKSYHTTRSCSALANSKTILEGTIKESGKDDPCDRCH